MVIILILFCYYVVITVTPVVTELTVQEPSLMAVVNIQISNTPSAAVPFNFTYATVDGTALGIATCNCIIASYVMLYLLKGVYMHSCLVYFVI